MESDWTGIDSIDIQNQNSGNLVITEPGDYELNCDGLLKIISLGGTLYSETLKPVFVFAELNVISKDIIVEQADRFSISWQGQDLNFDKSVITSERIDPMQASSRQYFWRFKQFPYLENMSAY